MVKEKRITPESIRSGLAASLRESRVIKPMCHMSLAEAACYELLTRKTLDLNEAIEGGEDFSTIAPKIESRNKYLKRWKSLFGFPYPL